MRVSVWILGDQLLAHHPALLAAQELTTRGAIRVVLVESAARLVRIPYHRKKLVLLLSAMRHYADELRAKGYGVDYLQAPDVITGLRQHVAAWQPEVVLTMAAAEHRGRRFQQERLAGLLDTPAQVLPNTQFLTGQFEPAPASTKKVILETFYRAVRRRSCLLLDEHGAPAGGVWNLDKENRQPLPKRGLSIPSPLTFAPDVITQHVMAEVSQLEPAYGAADDFAFAVTRADAETALADFITRRLPNFGAYEDAMSAQHAVLFHSLISPYLNIGLLEPLATARRAEAAYLAGQAPLAAVEGFIRQVVGWREYIYWQYWRQMPGLLATNSWQHSRPLPRFFWDGETPLNCLRHVIRRVLADGYSHHIERLMVICNFCLLAGIEPGAVNDWFLSLYVDAYEWVVTPNVIGMGLNADGGQTATKPYIASANYIHKMSDYCAGCRFKPKARTGADACPYNLLYWNFLIEHEATLRANPRSGPAVLGLRNLDPEERTRIAAQAQTFLATLTGDTQATLKPDAAA